MDNKKRKPEKNIFMSKGQMDPHKNTKAHYTFIEKCIELQ